MEHTNAVLEYKCPCCDAPLKFTQLEQKLTCDSCGNEFEIDAVKAFNEDESQADSFSWEDGSSLDFSGDEVDALQTFTCPSCGGVLMTDSATAATFCPYCENPAILPGRLSGGLRPDGVLPFLKTKEDAKKAFADLCKNKPLLPKGFLDDHRLEKISGIYVPFWIYDCNGALDGRYRATRVRSWRSGDYRYTKTSHFLLLRQADADFSGIPMDASTKMDDALMESIEPFDYSKVVDFDTAYLSGFLADKFDIESAAGQDRVRTRVAESLDDLVDPSFIGYSSVIPTRKNIQVSGISCRYLLLPVWMLTVKYKGETYTFAMNGQTGKLTGTLPVSVGRAIAWFCGIALPLAVIISAVTML